ncbi:MAG: Protein TolB [Calditrichaeota bacterium]|nr:Protein TolB [Calditrichota bacterium]
MHPRQHDHVPAGENIAQQMHAARPGAATLSPLAALLLAAAFLLLPINASAQYFGQNKVNYRDFNWYYLQTEHFDIYYPEEYYEVAEFTGWEAEEALISIEDSWNYSLEGRIIIIVFPSHNSFQNNNVGGSTPSESTGGFTEFLKNRVVIPYQGSNEMFRHVIHHELTHAVMLRMLYGEGVQSILTGLSRLPIPLWFIEGMAEYESQFGWSNEASMYIRDAIINDYLMPIEYLQGYFIYKGGQSVLYFLEERYGPEKVGELLRKTRSRRNFNGAVKDVLGYDLEELSERWHKHLKRQIWPTAAAFEAPSDFAVQITDHEEWYNFVNTSPALSPEGDRLAMLSDKDDYLTIYLVNTVTGEIEEKLISSSGGVYLFEQLLWLRPWIDWSPDGRSLAFVGEEHGEDVLYTLDVASSRITGTYRFGLDGVFSPTWSPDGSRILFAGYADGQSDLYIAEVGEPDSLRELTDDRFSDYDPDWGPDGRILFVSDRGDVLEPKQTVLELWNLSYLQNDIYAYNLASGTISRITNDEYEQRTPSFTPRNGVISYVSDRTGAYNLYLHELDTGDSRAVTDVLTGVFTPSWSSGGTVAFASFFNAGYDVYLYKNPFDPSRVKDPSLTYHQQKVRGLIDNTADLEARLKAMTEMAEDAPASLPADSALAGKPVEPGSEQEKRLLEALGEEAAADTVAAVPADTIPDAADSNTPPSGPAAGDTLTADPAPEQMSPAEADTAAHTSHSAVSRANRPRGRFAPSDTTVGVSEPDTTSRDTSAVEEEKVRLVSGTRERPAEQGAGKYRDYVFYPEGWDVDERSDEKEEEQAKPDSIFDEEGKFIPRKYKLKFSPDVVSAAAGYSQFFGLQGYGQIMISDVLGNHVIFVGTDLYYNFENSNFNLYYYHLPKRWDFGGGVFHNVYFFNGLQILDSHSGEPRTVDVRDRNWGATGTVSYPFSRNRRLDFSLGVVNIDRDIWDWAEYDYVPFQKRHFILPSLAYVFDNTIWGWTGPVNGARYRVGLAYSPKLDDKNPRTATDVWGFDFQTVSFDARRYFHVGRDYAFAFRLAGAASFGEQAQTFFLGGVSNWINRRFNGRIRGEINEVYFSGFATPLRGTDYYEDSGDRYLLLNNEFRFPLVRQVLFGWPLPFYFSNIRGAAFVDAGSAWYGDDFRLTEKAPNGDTRFRDLHLGFGWGFRLNLGIFLLKWDMAWKNELNRITQPRYYLSIGADL